MQTVTARITYFHKVKGGISNASFMITDASTKATLQNVNVQGNANWQYDWATYSGDIRALSSSQQNLCKKSEAYPSDQDLYNQSINNLQTNLKQQLTSFYASY